MFDSLLVIQVLVAVADMDECSTNNNLGPCGTTETVVSCTNNVGSYKCNCQTGYNFSNGACKGISSVI